MGDIRRIHDGKRYRRKDDAEVWVTKTATLVRGDSGEALYTLGIVQPITERKQAQEQLRLSEERYRLLVDGASDYAIFMVNPSNEIVYWSAGSGTRFRLECGGGDWAIWRAGFYAGRSRKGAGGKGNRNCATRWDGNDGGGISAKMARESGGWRMHRLDDEETALFAVLPKVARDRTEQRKAEEQLQRAHEELEKRVRERTAELQRGTGSYIRKCSAAKHWKKKFYMSRSRSGRKSARTYTTAFARN